MKHVKWIVVLKFIFLEGVSNDCKVRPWFMILSKTCDSLGSRNRSEIPDQEPRMPGTRELPALSH